MLVSRGRKQRPRPRPVEPADQLTGEVIGQRNFNHGLTPMDTDSLTFQKFLVA
jgi:hypothetical protein